MEVNGGNSFALKKAKTCSLSANSCILPADQFPYQFLRYSTAKTPGAPPGYQVKNRTQDQVKDDPAEIAAFIAAAVSCTEPPLPVPEGLEEAAEKLSSPRRRSA